MSSVLPLDPRRAGGDSMTSRLPSQCAPQYPGVFAITITPVPGEGMVELFQRLSSRLRERRGTILKLFMFGPIQSHLFAEIAMRQVFGGVDWPVTWVEGASCRDHPVAGIQALAVAASPVQRIVTRGRVTASVFEHGLARHCILGGIGPRTGQGNAVEQTEATFREMAGVLNEAGFSMNNLVRTWFYLDRLLEWYDDFNRVRSSVYSSVDFQMGAAPASTGVSGRNPAGTALTAGAWAIQPSDRSTVIQPVASPLQCSALNYGSSFSRAVEWMSPAGRTLLISGTASIAPEGRTQWQGDPARQINLTMDVIEAILESRQFRFSDITRATAYFRNPGDVRLFTRWQIDRNLPRIPVVAVQCDICRDDLLFELEVDAWKPGTASPSALMDFVL